MEKWEPNAIVAIDFGMTCTAVAYSFKPDWADPRVIQRWPGRHHLVNKVASYVGYGRNHLPVTWGFLSDLRSADTTVRSWFKLYLNPGFQDVWLDRPTHAQAVRWYTDYMTFLHRCLDDRFATTVPGWANKTVEYLFSIPTTWVNPALTAELETWLANAGFGQNNSKRRIKISLTEAEAAAVYAAKSQYEVNDVVCVVDAGGGTTDINILKVNYKSGEKTILEALNEAEGINVGSSLIDEQARRLVQAHLERVVGSQNPAALAEMAREMMQDDFEAFKCAFGGDGSDVDLELQVPGYPNQPAVISSIELQGLFDRQIAVMFEKIDDQIQSLRNQRPHEQLKYIVLSGGLGSSLYVQRQLQLRYSAVTPRFANSAYVQVLCADEPQLAVAKGLVMDRVQELRSGVGVYTGRCSRASYGVLCRRHYDPIKHRGERTTKDPFDGQVWAEDQIDWLIRKGEPVSQDGVLSQFQLKIGVGEEAQVWRAQIVMSEIDTHALPPSARFEEIKKVCTVYSTFQHQDFHGRGQSLVPFKLKSKGLFSSKRQYYLAEFAVKVVVGSADLKFQLVSKDGRTYNHAHEHIKVEWDEMSVAPTVAANMANMYRAQH